jgi:hypothetical protein
MATTKQVRAAKRNIQKAQTAAKSKANDRPTPRKRPGATSEAGVEGAPATRAQHVMRPCAKVLALWLIANRKERASWSGCPLH